MSANQEYHFFIFNNDTSHTFLIIPNYDDYLFTINFLKNSKEVANFFVVKGERVFDTNSD